MSLDWTGIQIVSIIGMTRHLTRTDPQTQTASMTENNNQSAGKQAQGETTGESLWTVIVQLTDKRHVIQRLPAGDTCQLTAVLQRLVGIGCKQ